MLIILPDLVRDGYAVVKGALAKEKALAYAEDIKGWLEDFGLGYDRNDPSTNREDCLPIIPSKGLLQSYGATHESFTWAVRSEPGVIGAFVKLYQDEDLIVSFDAINVSLARKDLPDNTAWPHQDQGRHIHFRASISPADFDTHRPRAWWSALRARLRQPSAKW